ncbi:MAG TPA: molybdopterin-dependent oxidoreductase [Blastocatellia bacterium]|nr:molybdopterin-dependent oxidoreductase [Blastocatellia bacterium]
MKKDQNDHSGSNAFRRRDFLIGAGQLTAGLAISRLLPESALAQTVIKGKEKLIVRSIRPEDLETPISLLNTWITPNNLFYVRHHLYAANVDVNEWKLTVGGEVQNPITLTLDELKRLPKHTVTVTLECAGNGRAFSVPPVPGIQWERGAVGTARFVGARLTDVLNKAGVKPSGQYVAFNGADKPMGKMPDFIRNVPIKKALDPDTILAYEMNGEAIPILHGFPLRLIVPGWEGAYSVKWVTDIQVIDKEFDGFFVKTAYRFPNRPAPPGAAVDPKDMAPLTGLVVKSFINSPIDGATVAPGPVRLSGFAWAGESNILKVDVSMDNGSSWRPAKLGRERERYAWQSFEYEFNITKPGSYFLMSRATDDKGRVQPIVPIWNPGGYLWNVIDKVRIDVKA